MHLLEQQERYSAGGADAQMTLSGGQADLTILGEHNRIDFGLGLKLAIGESVVKLERQALQKGFSSSPLPKVLPHLVGGTGDGVPGLVTRLSKDLVFTRCYNGAIIHKPRAIYDRSLGHSFR